jgi:hypothetical protein
MSATSVSLYQPAEMPGIQPNRCGFALLFPYAIYETVKSVAKTAFFLIGALFCAGCSQALNEKTIEHAKNTLFNLIMIPVSILGIIYPSWINRLQ